MDVREILYMYNRHTYQFQIQEIQSNSQIPYWTETEKKKTNQVKSDSVFDFLLKVSLSNYQ